MPQIENNNHHSAVVPVSVTLLTIKETARALSVSKGTIETLVRTRQLPSIKLGRARRIRVADLGEFAKTGITQIGAATVLSGDLRGLHRTVRQFLDRFDEKHNAGQQPTELEKEALVALDRALASFQHKMKEEQKG